MNSIQKYSKSLNHVAVGTKTQRRILYGLLALLTAAVIILGVAYFRAAAYRSVAQDQFASRVTNSVESALVELGGMSGGVLSNSSIKLARIRQYVYNLDQLNQISIRINGEAGRLVPQEAVTSLYDDIDTYEKLVQTATSSTLDIRTLLRTHLMALNEQLRK